jgi:hypothetical protein
MNKLKKSDIKLEFVENGRLTIDEMGEILGGEMLVMADVDGKISCGWYYKCPPNEREKNDCFLYKNCSIGNGKIVCENYFWVNPVDFAVTTPVISMDSVDSIDLLGFNRG